jgi:hypothetical protein
LDSYTHQSDFDFVIRVKTSRVLEPMKWALFPAVLRSSSIFSKQIFGARSIQHVRLGSSGL